MSLRFSRVTLYSAGKTTSFLVGGIQKSRTKLEGWTVYDNFVSDIPRYTSVNAHIEMFIYGGEEPFDATPEEVAYFYKRIERQPDFIDTRTEKIGKMKIILFHEHFSCFLHFSNTLIKKRAAFAIPLFVSG